MLGTTHHQSLNGTVSRLLVMHKFITVHWCEAVAFLGTSLPFWSNRFPEILLSISTACYTAAWTPLSSYCNNPTRSPTHLKPMGDTAGLATDRSRATTRLNTTLDSWVFSCIHCCHGHVFTVVLMGFGFTLLILPTERKCHEYNLWSLWSLTSATSAFVV